jgi:hypothetical protein
MVSPWALLSSLIHPSVVVVVGGRLLFVTLSKTSHTAVTHSIIQKASFYTKGIYLQTF